jgi:hypothetical protein
MKVRELQEMLEGYDPDDEIRVATQPNYPIAVELVGVTDTMKIIEAECDFYPNDDVFEAEFEARGQVIWLVTGSSPYDQPYAPRACWEAV